MVVAHGTTATRRAFAVRMIVIWSAVFSSAIILGCAVDRCESEVAGCDRFTEVRDSAGVVIVENEDAPERLDGWVVHTNPTLEIGADLGMSPDYQFASILGALRTADGGVVVADGHGDEPIVREYGPEGQVVGTWGRGGEGPGEFRSISGMHRLAPDSIVIWDLQLGRMTVFGPGGSPGRSTRLQVGSYTLEGTITGGGLLFGEIRTFTFQAGVQHSDGYHRYNKVYRIHDRDARPIGILGPFADQEYHNTITSTALRFIQLPYSRQTSAGIWNGLPVVGVSDTYEIRAYAADGSPSMIVRLDRRPTPVAAADRQAYLQVDQEDLLANRINVPMASHIPMFDAIIGDELGCLWVRDYDLPGQGPNTWTVFNSRGTAIARSEMSDSLRIWEIGRDYVLASQTGPLGIQSLVVLPLRSSDCR